MKLVSFFCARPGLWEGSSQSTCANGRRHIMYHRAAKHTALCKSKRKRGRGQQLEILSHLNICWRSNSALQWLRKKTVIMGDMMENRVVSALTQHISWPNGNINRDHLAPLGNHMDIGQHFGTTWRHIATILGQHCLVTVGGAYLCQYGHVLVNA